MSEQRDMLVDSLLAEVAGGDAPRDLSRGIMARIACRRRRRIVAISSVAAVAAAALLAALLVETYPSPRLAGAFEVRGGGGPVRGSRILAKGDDTTIQLGGYCRVSLQRDSIVSLGGDEGAEVVYLERGSAKCDVDSGVGAFSVETAVGTVKVTGTQFEVLLFETKESDVLKKHMLVSVFAGAVVVSGAWGEQAVGAGDKRILPPRTAPSASTTAPTQVRVEAEGTANGYETTSDWAWGGKAAASAKSWDPLLRSAWPAKAPTGNVHLWARHRHGSVCLKSLEAGRQKERGWAWASTDDFAWSHFGPFPATDFSGGVLVIRNQAKPGDPATELDCLVISASDKEPATPPLPPKPGVAELEVSWGRNPARTTGRSFGLNLNFAFELDRGILTNPAYRAGIKVMSPRFVRLWGGQDHLWDQKAKRLDSAKLATLAPRWKGLAPEIMVTIGGWPGWMDANGDQLLDEDRIDEYAAGCGEFVRVVNVQCGTGVRLWETSNERDGLYWGDRGPKGTPADMARIHAACAKAMKAVDPTIMVGGPAATRPDWRDGIARFAAAAGTSLDFLSFHAYASGSAGDNDDHVLRRVGQIARECQALQKRVASATGRSIPGFLDEYNISWTWETRDPRMTNQFSAVYDGLTMIRLAEHGIEGSAAWNEYDGVYGKMNFDFKLRPAHHVFARCNKEMVGAIATVAAPADAPACLVVRRADGTRAAMLVNTDRRPVTVRLQGLAGRLRLAVLENGAIDERDAAWGDTITLPGRSVSWAVDAK